MARREEGYQAREREHFDRLAAEQGITWWGRKTHAGALRMERRARLVRDWLTDCPGRSFLEIGCGAGEFTAFLARAVPDAAWVACDISPRALEHCRARVAGAPGRVSVEAWDLCAPFPAGRRFDAIVGCSILHHLPLAATLRHCHEALLPGGKVWFSEPNMANPQVWSERHLRWVGAWLDTTPDETAFHRAPLARAFAQAGFAEVRVRPFDFLHPLVPAALAPAVEGFGIALERLPGVREIAGSLEVTARRDAPSDLIRPLPSA